jgi:FkbM family methyltransferase
LIGTVTGKVRAAHRLLRNKGISGFSKVVYGMARLKLEIYARGRNKIVSLDGCRFELRDIPDTPMKVELLTGRYEEPERSAARRYIRAEWPVVELGGCIGVVACITNKLLQDSRAHVVLEANPLAIPHLESNRDANGCSFKIVNRALAYDSDSVTFSPLADLWGNSLLHDGSRLPPVTVATTQLRQILQEEQFDKYALICDIEGLEYELVSREPEALRRAELIIMEVHPHMIGEEKAQTVISTFVDLGFKTIDRSALVIVLSKAS